MISAGQIADILSVYKKHGWVLRRVLLSGALMAKLKDASIFEGVSPEESAVDGLWFSRPSKGTLVAWELRHLSIAPFAFVEVMESDIDKTEQTEIFLETENRILEAISRKKQGNF